MEVEVVDLTISCRLCLIPITGKAIDLHSEELMAQLEFIFLVSFKQKDWFPRTVCHECLALVTTTYAFVQKVRDNQYYLESLDLSYAVDAEPVEIEVGQSMKIDTGDLVTTENGLSEDPSEEDCKEEPVTVDESTSEPEMELKIPRKPRKLRKKLSQTKDDELIRQYYKFQCDLCSEGTSNFNTLLGHFREKHKVSGYIKCCNKKLYRRCRLLEHISKHLNPDTFRCEMCNKSYSCKTSLELHNMHLHLPETEKPFKCTKCPRSFAKDYQLKCHIVRHVAVECPKCGRIMSSRLSLRDHLIKMHSEVGQRLMVCDTCGKGFRSKTSFQRHVLLHQGVTQENRIQCNLCSRWLINKMGLKKHIRTQHTEVGEIFVCADCGKIAPNSAALQQHRRVVHSEQKFACEICEKSFKRAIALKEHRATHTGETLYSCKFCPMTFISNANMYTHQKKIHPKQWEKTRKGKLKEEIGNGLGFSASTTGAS
ncbi:transcription factor grauzone-like [Ochlerotatus camptorhynchus]|uniref:transcription factor grauzone-like n=1 Tax=Ochlerotatus camptorhynchus TaxID=644619 RepID=UPI0031E16CCC